MKKIIAILMLAVLVIPLAGCSGGNEPLQQEVERLEENAEKNEEKTDDKAADKDNVAAEEE